MIEKLEVGHSIALLLSCRKLKTCTEIDEGVYVATLGVIMQYQAALGYIRRYWAILGDMWRYRATLGTRVGLSMYPFSPKI